MISHPMHIGMHADIMVPLLPRNAHMGDDNGDAITTTNGTILPTIYLGKNGKHQTNHC